MSTVLQGLGRDVALEKAGASVGDHVERRRLVVVGDESAIAQFAHCLIGSRARKPSVFCDDKRRADQIVAAILQKFEHGNVRTMHPGRSVPHWHVRGNFRRHGIKLCGTPHFDAREFVLGKRISPPELSVSRLSVGIGSDAMGYYASLRAGVVQQGGRFDTFSLDRAAVVFTYNCCAGTIKN